MAGPAIVAAAAVGWACAIDAPRREPAPQPDAATLAASFAGLAAALDAPDAQPGVLAPGAAVTARLAFGAEADLDLYVTDPSLDSIYFAKRDSVTGGHLVADRRCDAPAPRIELAAYPTATPGDWRVGVDHPARCDEGDEAAAFVVELAAPGLVRRVEGTVAPGEFRIVVIEATLSAAAPAAPEARSSKQSSHETAWYSSTPVASSPSVSHGCSGTSGRPK